MVVRLAGCYHNIAMNTQRTPHMEPQRLDGQETVTQYQLLKSMIRMVVLIKAGQTPIKTCRLSTRLSMAAFALNGKRLASGR